MHMIKAGRLLLYEGLVVAEACQWHCAIVDFASNGKPCLDHFCFKRLQLHKLAVYTCCQCLELAAIWSMMTASTKPAHSEIL